MLSSLFKRVSSLSTSKTPHDKTPTSPQQQLATLSSRFAAPPHSTIPTHTALTPVTLATPQYIEEITLLDALHNPQHSTFYIPPNAFEIELKDLLQHIIKTSFTQFSAYAGRIYFDYDSNISKEEYNSILHDVLANKSTKTAIFAKSTQQYGSISSNTLDKDNHKNVNRNKSGRHNQGQSESSTLGSHSINLNNPQSPPQHPSRRSSLLSLFNSSQQAQGPSSLHEIPLQRGNSLVRAPSLTRGASFGRNNSISSRGKLPRKQSIIPALQRLHTGFISPDQHRSLLFLYNIHHKRVYYLDFLKLNAFYRIFNNNASAQSNTPAQIQLSRLPPFIRGNSLALATYNISNDNLVAYNNSHHITPGDPYNIDIDTKSNTLNKGHDKGHQISPQLVTPSCLQLTQPITQPRAHLPLMEMSALMGKFTEQAGQIAMNQFESDDESLLLYSHLLSNQQKFEKLYEPLQALSLLDIIIAVHWEHPKKQLITMITILSLFQHCPSDPLEFADPDYSIDDNDDFDDLDDEHRDSQDIFHKFFTKQQGSNTSNENAPNGHRSSIHSRKSVLQSTTVNPITRARRGAHNGLEPDTPRRGRAAYGQDKNNNRGRSVSVVHSSRLPTPSITRVPSIHQLPCANNTIGGCEDSTPQGVGGLSFFGGNAANIIATHHVDVEDSSSHSISRNPGSSDNTNINITVTSTALPQKTLSYSQRSVNVYTMLDSQDTSKDFVQEMQRDGHNSRINITQLKLQGDNNTTSPYHCPISEETIDQQYYNITAQQNRQFIVLLLTFVLHLCRINHVEVLNLIFLSNIKLCTVTMPKKSSLSPIYDNRSKVKDDEAKTITITTKTLREIIYDNIHIRDESNNTILSYFCIFGNLSFLKKIIKKKAGQFIGTTDKPLKFDPTATSSHLQNEFIQVLLCNDLQYGTLLTTAIQHYNIDIMFYLLSLFELVFSNTSHNSPYKWTILQYPMLLLLLKPLTFDDFQNQVNFDQLLHIVSSTTPPSLPTSTQPTKSAHNFHNLFNNDLNFSRFDHPPTLSSYDSTTLQRHPLTMQYRLFATYHTWLHTFSLQQKSSLLAQEPLLMSYYRSAYSATLAKQSKQASLTYKRQTKLLLFNIECNVFDIIHDYLILPPLLLQYNPTIWSPAAVLTPNTPNIPQYIALLQNKVKKAMYTQITSHLEKVTTLYKFITQLVLKQQFTLQSSLKNAQNVIRTKISAGALLDDVIFSSLFIHTNTNKTILTTLIEADIQDNIFLTQIMMRIELLRGMINTNDFKSNISLSESSSHAHTVTSGSDTDKPLKSPSEPLSYHSITPLSILLEDELMRENATNNLSLFSTRNTNQLVARFHQNTNRDALVMKKGSVVSTPNKPGGMTTTPNLHSFSFNISNTILPSSCNNTSTNFTPHDTANNVGLNLPTNIPLSLKNVTKNLPELSYLAMSLQSTQTNLNNSVVLRQILSNQLNYLLFMQLSIKVAINTRIAVIYILLPLLPRTLTEFQKIKRKTTIKEDDTVFNLTQIHVNLITKLICHYDNSGHCLMDLLSTQYSSPVILTYIMSVYLHYECLGIKNHYNENLYQTASNFKKYAIMSFIRDNNPLFDQNSTNSQLDPKLTLDAISSASSFQSRSFLSSMGGFPHMHNSSLTTTNNTIGNIYTLLQRVYPFSTHQRCTGICNTHFNQVIAPLQQSMSFLSQNMKKMPSFSQNKLNQSFDDQTIDNINNLNQYSAFSPSETPNNHASVPTFSQNNTNSTSSLTIHHNPNNPSNFTGLGLHLNTAPSFLSTSHSARSGSLGSHGTQLFYNQLSPTTITHHSNSQSQPVLLKITSNYTQYQLNDVCLCCLYEDLRELQQYMTVHNIKSYNYSGSVKTANNGNSNKRNQSESDVNPNYKSLTTTAFTNVNNVHQKHEIPHFSSMQSFSPSNSRSSAGTTGTEQISKSQQHLWGLSSQYSGNPSDFGSNPPTPANHERNGVFFDNLLEEERMLGWSSESSRSMLSNGAGNTPISPEHIIESPYLNKSGDLKSDTITSHNQSHIVRNYTNENDMMVINDDTEDSYLPIQFNRRGTTFGGDIDDGYASRMRLNTIISINCQDDEDDNSMPAARLRYQLKLANLLESGQEHDPTPPSPPQPKLDVGDKEELYQEMHTFQRFSQEFFMLLNHFITLYTFPTPKLHHAYQLPLEYRKILLNNDDFINILQFNNNLQLLSQYIRKCSISFNFRLSTIPHFSTTAQINTHPTLNKTASNLSTINTTFNKAQKPQCPYPLYHKQASTCTFTIFQRMVINFGTLSLIDQNHPQFASFYTLLNQALIFDQETQHGCFCPHCAPFPDPIKIKNANIGPNGNDKFIFTTRALHNQNHFNTYSTCSRFFPYNIMSPINAEHHNLLVIQHIPHLVILIAQIYIYTELLQSFDALYQLHIQQQETKTDLERAIAMYNDDLDDDAGTANINNTCTFSSSPRKLGLMQLPPIDINGRESLNASTLSRNSIFPQYVSVVQENHNTTAITSSHLSLHERILVLLGQYDLNGLPIPVINWNMMNISTFNSIATQLFKNEIVQKHWNIVLLDSLLLLGADINVPINDPTNIFPPESQLVVSSPNQLHDQYSLSPNPNRDLAGIGQAMKLQQRTTSTTPSHSITVHTNTKIQTTQHFSGVTSPIQPNSPIYPPTNNYSPQSIHGTPSSVKNVHSILYTPTTPLRDPHNMPHSHIHDTLSHSSLNLSTTAGGGNNLNPSLVTPTQQQQQQREYHTPQSITTYSTLSQFRYLPGANTFVHATPTSTVGITSTNALDINSHLLSPDTDKITTNHNINIHSSASHLNQYIPYQDHNRLMNLAEIAENDPKNLNTALFECVRYRFHSHLLALFISHGANVQYINKHGQVIEHFCCDDNYLDLMEYHVFLYNIHYHLHYYYPQLSSIHEIDNGGFQYHLEMYQKQSKNIDLFIPPFPPFTFQKQPQQPPTLFIRKQPVVFTAIPTDTASCVTSNTLSVEADLSSNTVLKSMNRRSSVTSGNKRIFAAPSTVLSPQTPTNQLSAGSVQMTGRHSVSLDVSAPVQQRRSVTTLAPRSTALAPQQPQPPVSLDNIDDDEGYLVDDTLENDMYNFGNDSYSSMGGSDHDDQFPEDKPPQQFSQLVSKRTITFHTATDEERKILEIIQNSTQNGDLDDDDDDDENDDQESTVNLNTCIQEYNHFFNSDHNKTRLYEVDTSTTTNNNNHSDDNSLDTPSRLHLAVRFTFLNSDSEDDHDNSEGECEEPEVQVFSPITVIEDDIQQTLPHSPAICSDSPDTVNKIDDNSINLSVNNDASNSSVSFVRKGIIVTTKPQMISRPIIMPIFFPSAPRYDAPRRPQQLTRAPQK